MTFALTGGDGVHFGFIVENESDIIDAPIVMTVPMSDKSNIVVAENFEEFLSLGHQIGWCGLEQLAYNEEEAIESYSKPYSNLCQKESLFFEYISRELKVTFKPITKSRLLELENKYFNKLKIDELKDEDLDSDILKILDDFTEKQKGKK